MISLAASCLARWLGRSPFERSGRPTKVQEAARLNVRCADNGNKPVGLAFCSRGRRPRPVHRMLAKGRAGLSAAGYNAARFPRPEKCSRESSDEWRAPYRCLADTAVRLPTSRRHLEGLRRYR